MESEFSRRDFLRGVAVAAGGAAMAGSLVGCGGSGGGSAAGANIKWDKEVDFLVVGSGTAAFGALSARVNGLENVLIVEKAPTFGGTSATSGGNFYVYGADCWREKEGYTFTDTEEEFWRYAKNCACGRIPDEEAFQAYIDNGNEFLRFVTENTGVEFGVIKPDTVDYYDPVPGYTPDGRGNVSPWNKDHTGRVRGAEVWAALLTSLESLGVEIMYETQATHLIKDDSGAVIGISAKDNMGEEIFIKSVKGVMVGTGGFEYNRAMHKQYLPFPQWGTVSTPYNTGDGHRMLMEAGANMILMDRSWGVPSHLKGDFSWDMDLFHDASVTDWIMDRGKPGAIVVNQYGKRFANECVCYDPFNRALGAFSSKHNNLDNIPAVFVCDSSYTQYYTLLPSDKVGEVPDLYFQADTLEEIAEHFNLPVDEFIAEVKHFNENAKLGIDPDFHRGEWEYDKRHTGDAAGLRPGLANPCLAPLETPPFIASWYVPGTMSTCGGAKINKHAQAMDINDKPIPGLFVVGATSGNISAGSYLGSGFTLTNGTVMAYIAGKYVNGLME